MNDFKDLMAGAGVRPLDARPVPGPLAQPARDGRDLRPATHAEQLHAWTTDREARLTLETAIVRLQQARRTGGTAWITLIAQDGTCIAHAPTGPLTSASVIAHAERVDARLVAIAAPGWTCILHPTSGAATISNDPEGDAE